MKAAFEQMQTKAVRHLRRNCPVMREVIRQVGPCKIRLQRGRFEMLARSILFQQISGHAAKAILGRLLERMPNGRLSAPGLAALSEEEFRACGVSRQKAGYMRSLADLSLSGEVSLQRVSRWPDDRIIEELVQVKGIGVWTAQMFLMFSLGRPDVLPWDDLGVRQAMVKLFELDELPKREEAEQLAAPWRPYATVASWYCWRSLEIADPGMG